MFDPDMDYYQWMSIKRSASDALQKAIGPIGPEMLNFLIGNPCPPAPKREEVKF